MATEKIAIDGREQSTDSLDMAFDLLAHSYRRTVIEELERDAPQHVTEMAQQIAEREDERERSVQVELAHRHLPRLDDADVIDYDTSTQQCKLDRAETVRAVLDAINDVA